jgi:hypothetical protein
MFALDHTLRNLYKHFIHTLNLYYGVQAMMITLKGYYMLYLKNHKEFFHIL